MKFHAIAPHACLMTLVLVSAACGGGSGATPFEGNRVSTAPNLKLTITQPTADGEMETSDDSVTVAGTADSNAGIVSVEWANDQGGQGTASGTESWTADSIPLDLGENLITVTAQDSTGATASRTILVKRETEGTGSVTLSWEAPTTRADGSPLANLAGYNIYYGRMSGVYDYEINIDNPGVTTYVVEGLTPGTWYFVLTSYDSDGIESDYSEEVVREVM